MEGLKQLLLGCTWVALPDLNREFIIQTDASGVGLGAVLLQEVDGLKRPIAFASRGLTPAEANYSVPQQECLAVVWAIKKFGQYIEYTHFTIETDHQALRWLRELKEPAGRLARWSLQLQALDFTVRYCKGSTNKMADALSRNPLIGVGGDIQDTLVTVAASEVIPEDFYPTHKRCIDAQMEDEFLALV